MNIDKPSNQNLEKSVFPENSQPSQDPSLTPLESGQMSIKRYGKWEAIKVILSNKESIKPLLSSLGYLIASKLTGLVSSKTSKKYQAKLTHSGHNLVKIWAHQYFGQDLVGNARNIARKTILSNKTDYIESVKLLNLCKTLEINKKTKAAVDTDSNPESQISDGICAGIRLDIAERILIHQESIEDIIASNEKGASAQAAANQAIYALLTVDEWNKGELVDRPLEHLKQMAKNHKNQGLFEADFEEVAKSLVAIDDDMSLDEGYHVLFEKYGHIPPSPNDKLPPLSMKMRNFILGAKVDVQKNPERHPFLAKSPHGGWTISNPVEFQQAFVRELNYDFKQLRSDSWKFNQHLLFQKERELQSVKWVVALLQLKQGITQFAAAASASSSTSKIPKLSQIWEQLKEKAIEVFGKARRQEEQFFDPITDPSIKRILRNLYDEDSDTIKYETVGMARGLQLLSVEDKIGHSCMYDNDASYLQNFSKLPEGIYAIALKTSTASHALTYIKENAEGEGYILDPNGFQLRCQNTQHGITLFLKLLSLYDEPKDKPVSSIKDSFNHLLEVKKIEPIAQQA